MYFECTRPHVQALEFLKTGKECYLKPGELQPFSVEIILISLDTGLTQSATLCMCCAGPTLLHQSSAVTNMPSRASAPASQAQAAAAAQRCYCVHRQWRSSVGSSQSEQDLTEGVPEACQGHNAVAQWMATCTMGNDAQWP